jgi:deferrochelatase/peroxidase EfeB
VDTGVGGLTRRSLLAASASVGLGAVAGAGVERLIESGSGGNSASPGDSGARVAFYGANQAGVTTPPPNFLFFAAFDFSSTKGSDLQELLAGWSAAAARLTAGEPLIAGVGAAAGSPPDTGESVGSGPSSLTLTMGLGPGLFESERGLGLERLRPAPLAELPAFPGESLEAGRSGGDLCVQACSDDAQVAFHAVHNLARIAAPVASVRWTQTGFARTSDGAGQVTPRNLIGFKDGTNNIDPRDPELMARYVWVGSGDGPGWMRGGSYLVARRIRILLDVWDADTLVEQEQTIGRHKLSGAPLGAVHEHDPVDLAATVDGEPLIPADAHIRLAAAQSNGGARILRRGYSFADPSEAGGGQLDAGLFFIAFQRDPRTQFVPIQRRLAENDALSKNLIHTASSVFAIPPGARHQGFVGETLF